MRFISNYYTKFYDKESFILLSKKISKNKIKRILNLI